MVRQCSLPQWLELIHATTHNSVPNSPLLNADAVTRFSQFSFFSLLCHLLFLLPFVFFFVFYNTATAFGTTAFVRFTFIETKDERIKRERERKKCITNIYVNVCVYVFIVQKLTKQLTKCRERKKNVFNNIFRNAQRRKTISLMLVFHMNNFSF